MKVYIVAATALELNKIKCPSEHFSKHVLGVGSFYFGQKLGELLSENNSSIDLIILVGVAGCQQLMNLGESFTITHDSFGDLGFISNQSYLSLTDLNLQDLSQPATTQRFNMAPKYAHIAPQIRSITVNSLTDIEEINNLRLEKHQAQLENMEGAAFHYICEKLEIPFLHIRGTSNHLGERDKNLWKMEEAIESYSTLTNKILASWS